MRIQHLAKIASSHEWKILEWGAVDMILYDDSWPNTALVWLQPGILISKELLHRNRPRALRRWKRTHRPFWPKRRERMAGK